VANDSAMSDAPLAKRFQFIAGNLCLDFCNTVGGKREGISRENLHDYAHFLSWSQQARLVDPSAVPQLQVQAAQSADKGAAVLGRAIALREAVYRIILAIAADAAPSNEDLTVLNSELARCLGRLRILPDNGNGAFSWGWAESPLDLDHALGPISYSAAELLASKEKLTHVRQCRADNCGWLFLDSSRNHSRCWCDMRDCGNRAKVRRHRRKHRDEQTSQ
jgi:predicted RNA-binding Zn ribbon-like protein